MSDKPPTIVDLFTPSEDRRIPYAIVMDKIIRSWICFVAFLGLTIHTIITDSFSVQKWIAIMILFILTVGIAPNLPRSK
ncbi:MAG TPA: hypothetical protein VFF49_06575 [Thermodesulfobacteriota bacterium]|nr:hypothetical protein [Thermodesulfobacteriota bacterium]